jgi:hypothetical protein
MNDQEQIEFLAAWIAVAWVAARLPKRKWWE